MNVVLLHGLRRVAGEHIDDRLLKACRHIGTIDRLALHLCLIEIIQHRRFQAAEAEIERLVELGAGKRDRRRIAFLGQRIDLWSARIAQTNGTRHFVKGFAGCIVDCLPEDLIVAVGSDLDNVRVPAGNNQTDARQRDLRMRQEVCVNMPFNMVSRR